MRPQDHLLYVEPRWAGVFRNGSAALLVLATAAVVAIGLMTQAQSPEASDVDDAVMVDLPAAFAGKGAGGETDGPARPAATAASSAPPQTPTDPTPPPPGASDPMAVASPVAAPPPKPAPATAEQAPMTPIGAANTAPPNAIADDAEVTHATMHALSLWQHAMVAHLAAAKRGLRAGGRHGTAVVAFTLGANGTLLAVTVSRSSGNPGLDTMAERLVSSAAPYPRPPAGAGDLSFTVPIHFGP